VKPAMICEDLKYTLEHALRQAWSIKGSLWQQGAANPSQVTAIFARKPSPNCVLFFGVCRKSP